MCIRDSLDTVHGRLYFLGPGDYDLMSMLPPGTECFELQKSTSGHLILPMTHYEELDMTKKTAKEFSDEAPRALHADESAQAASAEPPPGVEPPPGLEGESAGAAAAARPPSPTTEELLAALPEACTAALSRLDVDQLERLARAFGYQATEQIVASPIDTD